MVKNLWSKKPSAASIFEHQKSRRARATKRGAKRGSGLLSICILRLNAGAGLKYHAVALCNVLFVDCHVHLVDSVDPGKLLNYAYSTETLLFSVGVDRRSSVSSLSMAREHGAIVRAFVGVHPSESGQERTIEWLEGAAAEASGLGEIGLDPKYAAWEGAMETQVALFEKQLELAERLSLPVQVHSRGAERECLDLLSTYRVERVLMHWFESVDLAGEVAARGYFISFGPAVLYSKRLASVAASFPRELVLTESDGPVSFGPLGGASGPSTVPSVVFRLAALSGEVFEEVRERVLRNALSFLEEGRKG